MFGVDFVDLFSSPVFIDYISPFNICCKASLVVLNSLKFCLSEKFFISPLILNEILAEYSNLGCRFFPFSTLNISCLSLLAYRFSSERSAVKRMGFPLHVTCCISLAAFNILSLCLAFVSLISMCLAIFLHGFILYGTLCLLDLIDYFFIHVGKIFNYNLFKNFLLTFLFLFFFWDPYNSSVGAFNVVPEISETIFSSSHSFYFILLFRSYFHHFIFQLTDSFFCFRCSAVIPSRVFLISVIVLFVSVCLFFNFTFLLIDSCFFSILFSRFLIIFTIIILNYFSGSLSS